MDDATLYRKLKAIADNQVIWYYDAEEALSLALFVAAEYMHEPPVPSDDPRYYYWLFYRVKMRLKQARRDVFCRKFGVTARQYEMGSGITAYDTYWDDRDVQNTPVYDTPILPGLYEALMASPEVSRVTKEMLRLFVEEHLTYEQIAERQHCTYNAICKRMRKLAGKWVSRRYLRHTLDSDQLVLPERRGPHPQTQARPQRDTREGAARERA